MTGEPGRARARFTALLGVAGLSHYLVYEKSTLMESGCQLVKEKYSISVKVEFGVHG